MEKKERIVTDIAEKEEKIIKNIIISPKVEAKKIPPKTIANIGIDEICMSDISTLPSINKTQSRPFFNKKTV